MQPTRTKAEASGRKAKLAQSYQELLDDFSNKDLKSVGNYTLGQLIGKGSFGKVYLATHKLTNGSKVVLKSAKKNDSNLAREIHHHRQFVHPHIARLYEVIVTETMVWMVLEYCQGDELYNYLIKHGKLPVDKVQKIFAQLVGAVSYVHMQSCVHRDLKLENILLDKHENVKLVDFGFTRGYEGKANYLQTFCGTICYSAPEMLKGEKYAGEKVDVWSLGVILYALLCGELPFDDDDDDVTRRKILSEEPAFPDHIPAEALALLKSLLSKRPLLRPTLPDILNHPFLADFAPQQQSILKLQQPSAFTTPVEKETLQRMRSAGVDIDSVIESVLAQRCDALAGWWTLLVEKEQRKVARRERKRKEKELERRNSRRLSTTSSRLERLATVEETGATSGSASYVKLGDPQTPKSRGRTPRRSGHYDIRIEDFPGLSELGRVNEAVPSDLGPPPLDKDSVRSASSSRQRRPIPPPKEGVIRSARSRGSTLHVVTATDALAATRIGLPGGQEGRGNQRVRKKTSQLIITQWKNMTHWISENTRRNKGADKHGSHSTPNLHLKLGGGGSGKGSVRDDTSSLSKDASPRPQTSKYPTSGTSAIAVPGGLGNTASLPKGVVANGYIAKGALGSSNGPGGSDSFLNSGKPGARDTSAGSSAANHSGTASNSNDDSGNNSNGNAGKSTANSNIVGYLPPSRMPTNSSAKSNASYKRLSLSPSPLTPRSSNIRHSSAGHGLRGRKSTSSSVSSIRSIHQHQHHHSHSKASSTSSNASVSTSISKTPSIALGARSPHHSVKVLPATPTITSFPSSLRLVRGQALTLSANSNFNEGMPFGRSAAAPGSPAPAAMGSSFHGSSGGGGGFPGSPVVFAKRKRNIFKGPMLAFGGGGSSGKGGSGGSGAHSRSASASGLGRRSGEMPIAEEDEDEDEDDNNGREQALREVAILVARTGGGIGGGHSGGRGSGRGGGRANSSGHGDGDVEVEEVDSFSPIIQRPGEYVEEMIYEDDDKENYGTEVDGIAGTGRSSGAAKDSGVVAVAGSPEPAAPADNSMQRRQLGISTIPGAS